MTEELPESDRVPGAPHPRNAASVIGHDHAVQEFLASAQAHRLHHAWLITGPRGIGKATLAWALARWLLAEGQADDLHIPPEHPVARRISALSEPRVNLVRRGFDAKTGRLKAEIGVEDIRALLSFFHMSAAEGGHRVAIVDAADQMNNSAANALLKVLEEPPQGGVILLIAHQPARLLPTIRSRCRELRLSPLPADTMRQVLAGLGTEEDAEALAALSAGSVGEALRLAGQDGLKVYGQIIACFDTLPRFDRIKARAFAEAAGGRATAEGDPFDLRITLLDLFLTRLARSGLMGAPIPEAAAGEGALMARLCPDAEAARIWAEAQSDLSARARAGRAVNLDPAALVMDMLIQLAGLAPAHMKA
ncbi:DNA polymerase III subunit delta' [Paracoccus aerodenitrificans]|uniref:DNA polymerase III subunit delta' n=1 Tax=Paracoccus aerodenitrificans TaxID=3017781 RepID=UPI0022F001C0|nr:DNA polymerase III subunit delta' [Paracoccus aerodenitrificans]WBU64437.1 DNA polymerase III subunit delta' [Paracoccus aerodenitrificans]